jgi:hypothetical protein
MGGGLRGNGFIRDVHGLFPSCRQGFWHFDVGSQGDGFGVAGLAADSGKFLSVIHANVLIPLFSDAEAAEDDT